MIYLDHAASSPLLPEVAELLSRSLKEDFANPSSAHRLCRDLSHRLEDARRVLLDLLCGLELYQFVFTSSASESNNTLIQGIDWKEGDEILISRTDHPSVVVPAESLMAKGVQLVTEVGPKTRAVFLTLVNSQSGAIVGPEKIKEFKKNHPKVLLFVDGVQAMGKFPWMRTLLKDGVIDGLSISAHKMGGPKGVAGFYLKNGVQLRPLLVGGGQENSLRASTVAVPLVFGFQRAAELRDRRLAEIEKVSALNLSLRESLKEIPAIRFPFGPPPETSPFILSFVLPPVSSDIVLRHLEEKGIILSSTSACSSRIKGKNPVLLALGIPESEHKWVLRVSLSQETTEAEIKTFAQELKAVHAKLSRLLGGN